MKKETKKTEKGFDFRTITSFEAACAATNKIPDDVYHEKDAPDDVERKKLKVITEAINHGVIMDYKNKNQRKWFPIFYVSSSGLVFDDSLCDYDCTHTYCGSRLCFETEEKSDFAGKTFIKSYEIMLTK